MAKRPLRARAAGFPWAGSAPALTSQGGFDSPRRLLLLIQQLQCKTLQGNN